MKVTIAQVAPKGALVLFLSALTGCSVLIPASDNSLWTKNEKCNVTFGERSTQTTRVRYFALWSKELKPPASGQTAQPKDFGASALAAVAVPLAMRGVEWIYDQVVEAIEDEAKRYHASYSGSAAVDNFYRVQAQREVTLTLTEAEAMEWLQSGPVSGVAIPSSVLAKWRTAMNDQAATMDFSDDELVTLRRLYSAVVTARREWYLAKETIVDLPEFEWTLYTTQFEVAPLAGFTFLRRACPPGETSPADALAFDGSIERTPSGARVEIRNLRIRAAKAKIPAERWWIPGSWVLDELEDSVDLAIRVRVEHGFRAEDGRYLREVLLDEVVAQASGVDLAGVVENGYLRDSTLAGPFRSGEFAMPRFDGALYEGREFGSIRLIVTVEEQNKAGEYLRRGADAARERKDDVLDRIEDELDKLTERLGGEEPPANN